MNECDVSIIVCLYNPDLEKMRRTLDSVIRQKGVKFEVIIADDGSEESYLEWLNRFFIANDFGDYLILESDENKGTVINQYNAMLSSSGKYIRGMSPGDYFVDDYSVDKLFRYAENHKSEICFGDLIYYDIDESGNTRIIREKNSPRHPEIYDDTEKNARAIEENYLVFNESISGASFFYKRDITLQYLARFRNKVKYTEDQVFRLMVIDGIRPLHVPELIVFYEFGTGISTGKKTYWNMMIKNDTRAVRHIIRDSITNASYFYRRLKLSFAFCDNSFLFKVIRVLLFPRGAFRELLYSIKPKYTQTTVNKSEGEM